jgi:holo-[acyl-carrier protein] synthase
MKPLLPFPIPLNIGTDICQISRIYGILNSPRATRFVHRILAPDEKSRNDPRLQVLQRARESLKLASKEIHSQDHRKIEAEDPDLWKCAAFIAGRFVSHAHTLHSQKDLLP